MRLRLRRNSDVAGTALLEMVLFTPLAFLFLFVVIDAGMAYVERAAVIDAIRAGLNTEGLYTEDGTVLGLGDHSEVIVAEEGNVNALVDGVADEVMRRVKRAQGIPEGQDPETLRVAISAITLTIDPQTGREIGPRTFERTVFQPDQYVNAHLPHNNADFNYTPRDNFIVQQLGEVGEHTPSPYAVPLAVVYDPQSSDPGEMRYLDRSVVLYAEVSALTRGVSPLLSRTILGNFYGLQRQQLILVRTQVD